MLFLEETGPSLNSSVPDVLVSVMDFMNSHDCYRSIMLSRIVELTFDAVSLNKNSKGSSLLLVLFDLITLQVDPKLLLMLTEYSFHNVLNIFHTYSYEAGIGSLGVLRAHQTNNRMAGTCALQSW